nr:trichohyalin [Syngnathus scovelli]
MRSSRSLNRLDQRATGRDVDVNTPHSNQSKLNIKNDNKVEYQDNGSQTNTCCEGAKEEIKLQQKMEETSADISSVSSPSLSPISSPCTDSPLSHFSPTQQAEEVGSPYSSSCVIQSNEDSSDQEHRPSEEDRERLVKELEKTQMELSQIQQLNRKLQDEIKMQDEIHLSEKNDLLFNSNASSDPASALHRLQKMNRELRVDLEAQKRIQEEAREADLRQRVELLAQQAQVLVTGDATALAQVHLEQERRWFHEQKMEWERSLASLKNQLSFSEDKRKELELRMTRLQEESCSHQVLQDEAQELRKALQEATTQLRTNEDAQAQKESLLQKHLMLLQESQDRERKSLSASLARAEKHSQELQKRLDQAEEQVESLTKVWSRDIEDTREQLREELASSAAAVQKYQDEKEQMEQRCQELQNLLTEEREEKSRLQDCLETEETYYQDLKHSYEKISEELLTVLEKAQQRETEVQEIRNSFERLLDEKEQELNEVLLKMEVLGNSLEETEAQLNEKLKVCGSSHVEEESLEAVPHEEEEMVEPASENTSEEQDQNQHHHARIRSYSLGPSHQYIITAGDDPERFTSAIQLLETKLFVTEEKLREITERLEEHQDHETNPDPRLNSQLTHSRASAQHLALLLHSRASQNQRFAQETENLCRLLAGRFQLALNILQSCREKLQTSQAIELTDFEGRLAAVETCLQRGRNDAEKQQRASLDAYKMEDKIPSDVLAGVESSVDEEDLEVPHAEDIISVGKFLKRQLILVEKMLAALKSPNVQLRFLVPKEEDMSVAYRYKLIISQILTLKQTQFEEGGSWEDHEIIMRACIEAEFIYAAFKIQQEYQKDNPADSIHPIFGFNEEQENKKDQSEDIKNPPWLERLITRLQRRAKVMWKLYQEVTIEEEDICETVSRVDLQWMQEQVKLLYLSDRLHLDLEQEQQRCVMLQDKLCKQQEASLTDEREVFNRTLNELQEDNKALREELEHAEDALISMKSGNQNKWRIEEYQKEKIQRLEAEIQMKDVKVLNDDVKFATLPSSRVIPRSNSDVNAANTSNTVKKNSKPSLLRRFRAVRSKSLKEGLSGQERRKLFD